MSSAKAKISGTRRKKFALIIGDEGVVLVLLYGEKVEKRLYAPAKDQPAIDEIIKTIALTPLAPITIILDTIDQSFIPQSFPGVSGMTIAGLVKKRLNRDFPKDSLKTSLFISRDQKGRKNWNYMLIAVPMTPPLSIWIENLSKLPNYIDGIYSLPLEAANIVQMLDLIIEKMEQEEKEKAEREKIKVELYQATEIKLPELKQLFNKLENTEEDTWKLLIVHNRVSGIRQIAFKNDKIILTRITSFDNSESATVLAGNIEQEINNSIEYLQRLALNNVEKLSIYMITSSEIKGVFSTQIKINAGKTCIFSPYEVVHNIDLKETASIEDRFTDVILASYLLTRQPKKQRLINKDLSFMQMVDLSAKYAKIPLYFLIPIFCLSIIYNLSQTIENRVSLNKVTSQKIAAEERLDNIQKTISNLSDGKKIIDLVKLYKILSNNTESPLKLIQKISTVIDENILLKSFSWEIPELNISNTQVKTSDKSANNLSNSLENTNIKKYKIKAIFNLEFYNNNGYEELFNSFDKFITKIEDRFKEYNIVYSRIDDQINFNETNKIIPVKVTINGPKDDAKSN